jgi:glutathione S-transferase
MGFSHRRDRPTSWLARGLWPSRLEVYKRSDERHSGEHPQRPGPVATRDLALQREGAVGAGLQARPPHPPLAASRLPCLKAKSLTGDISTTPVLTLDGQSVGDSTRIIAALEERWPQPPLYPPDAAQRQRALELEEFFDEELGPHIRRVAYQELLPHPGLVAPLFSHGQRLVPRILMRAGFPMLRVGVQRRFAITAEAAQESRAKTVAAMDRLEREISPSGYLVGESFTVADLTAAALFYPVALPPEFPYPMVGDHDLPESLRQFRRSLGERPGGKWVAEIYHRHRFSSAEQE